VLALQESIASERTSLYDGDVSARHWVPRQATTANWVRLLWVEDDGPCRVPVRRWLHVTDSGDDDRNQSWCDRGIERPNHRRRPRRGWRSQQEQGKAQLTCFYLQWISIIRGLLRCARARKVNSVPRALIRPGRWTSVACGLLRSAHWKSWETYWI
jgi:hypothetical protein